MFDDRVSRSMKSKYHESWICCGVSSQLETQSLTGTLDVLPTTPRKAKRILTAVL